MLSKFFITSTRFENMGMFQKSTYENDMMICGNTNERFKKKGKSRRTQVRRERRAEAAKDAISRWKGTIEVTNWPWRQ